MNGILSFSYVFDNAMISNSVLQIQENLTLMTGY